MLACPTKLVDEGMHYLWDSLGGDEKGPGLRRSRPSTRRTRLAPMGGGADSPPPSKKVYEAPRCRSTASATTPDTISTRVAAMVINSGVIGGPPVSASAVAVGLAVAVAIPVAVDAGLAVPPVTVTLPMASRV